MTQEKSNLLNYEAFKSPIEIKLADDDSIVLSYGKGDVKLANSDDGGNEITILKDVLYVPNIQNNLFSLPAITDKGIPVSFNKNACEIIIGCKKVVKGHKYGKSFKLDVLSNYDLCQLAKSDTKPKLWHKHYGHLGYENLKMLKSKNMVNGINVDVNKLPCKGCALGKQHRNSFPKTSDNLTKQLLETVHSDVCGLMNVDSIVGSNYFVTFIDDFSRYTTVFTMKNKNEVFAKFKEYVAYIENQANFKN